MITTTLNRIKKHRPCEDGWKKLLNGLGKKKADDEPLSFATILEISGLNDALWCCRVEPQYAREWRLFAVACARRVEHPSHDPRVKDIIDDAARDGAPWYAARGVARDVAIFAAICAVRDSGNAAWTNARDAERKWQKQEFLRVVTETE